MATMGSASQWYLGFRIAIFALLAGDTLIYAISDTPNRALDSAAWLLLLALFVLETRFGEFLRGGRAVSFVRSTRFAAAIGVCAAAAGYVYQQEWLDAVNSGLWITVVLIFEVEIRLQDRVAQYRTAFVSTAAVLYSGLAFLVLVWAWRREWFDAYDALLWLTSFATIEMDVLQASGKNNQRLA
jgi:hypothetical protein